MPADLDYKDLFRDAVHMLAYIARAAGFDPNDPTVEPPAIVARVERLRARADALQARLAALAAPVEGVDVEEVLRIDAVATPGPWRAVGASIRVTLPEGIEYQWATASYPRDTALVVNYRTAAPALAREVVALRDALATAEAERDELRLTLAAEQGKAEGAPPGWSWTGGMWRRNGYPHAITAWRYEPTNQPWQWEVWDTRPAFDVRLLGKGYAPTARAAMLAADEVKP